MDKHEFEKFLHEKIPATKAMKVKVAEFGPSKVRLEAELEPNVNDKGTAFGGSISSLMTLCGWSMMFSLMAGRDPGAQIVVSRSSMRYIAPIKGDFAAECSLPEDRDVSAFLEAYKDRKKARLSLKVRCFSEGELAADYDGQYVAYAVS